MPPTTERGKDVTLPFNIVTPPNTGITPNRVRSADAKPPEQNDFYRAFWDQVIETSRNVPPGEDPAYWPLHITYELDEIISVAHISNLKPEKTAFVNSLAPFQDSLRKIKSAYTITAYPISTTRKSAFSVQLEHDQRALEIDGKPRQPIHLNDLEADILGRLCATQRYQIIERDEHGRSFLSPMKRLFPPVPFDPQKRIYHYTEVPPSKT